MSQQPAHFLGVIDSPAWQERPGSSVLIELGPVARAAVAAAYEHLRQQPAAARSVELAQVELQDVSVRQVTVDGMDRLSGGVVGRFEKEAQNSPGPITLPGDQMKHVLLLTDEHDDLRLVRLTVSQQGTLHVQDGRWAVKGSIEIDKLADY